MIKSIDLLVRESLRLMLMLALALNINTSAPLSMGKTGLFSQQASFCLFMFLTSTCVDNKRAWLSVWWLFTSVFAVGLVFKPPSSPRQRQGPWLMNTSRPFFKIRHLGNINKAKRHHKQPARTSQPPSLFVLKQFNQFLFVLPVKHLLKSCHTCIKLKSG